MTRRNDLQSGTGRELYYSGIGWLMGFIADPNVGIGPPVNGQPNWAPSAQFFDLKNGKQYTNRGTNTSAYWVENDGSSGTVAQFGNAAMNATTPFNVFRAEGNLYVNSKNPIASNAADTTDDILDGIQMPANVFDQAFRGVTLAFAGNCAANGNNKRVKIWANPTMAGQTINATTGVISGGTVTGAGAGALLLDSGVQTTNNGGWEMSVNIFKYGAAGSNTQTQSGSQFAFGSTHGGTTLSTALTLPENAAINLVITGSSPTTGAAGDISLWWTQINANN